MAASQARRKRYHKQKTVLLNGKRVWLILAVNCSVLLIIGVLLALYYHPMFAVNNIEVDNNINNSHARQLAQALDSAMGRSLLVLSTGHLQTRINQLNWVKQSAVRRVWPHKLRIKLKKQVPVAYWRHHGLLDHHGRVFTFNQPHDTKLPIIEADTEDYPTAFRRLKKLQKKLDKCNLKPTQLIRYGSRTWYVRLNNELSIYLDDDHFHQELGHLLASYDQLFQDKQPNQYYVDLRYPHGLALGATQH